MQRGAKLGIVGAVCAGMLGVAGYGVYNVLDALNSDSTSSTGNAGSAKSTAPPDAKEITETAADFLAAWAAGTPRRPRVSRTPCRPPPPR